MRGKLVGSLRDSSDQGKEKGGEQEEGEEKKRQESS
jgi:hypothetical protein